MLVDCAPGLPPKAVILTFSAIEIFDAGNRYSRSCQSAKIICPWWRVQVSNTFQTEEIGHVRFENT